MKTKLTRITALFLAVALLLLTFAGCNKRSEMAEDAEPVKGPSLSDLMETDKLVIYTNKMYEPLDRRRISLFTALYDVDVEVVVTKDDEYTERVMNDLAGGTGPDVLFLEYLVSADIVKAALNQSFLDLTDILAEDPDFSKDDYVSGIFENSQINGRQYMVPTTYELPFMMSATDALKELGFDWNKIATSSDYLEELARLTPTAQQNTSFSQMLDSKNRFSILFAASGVRLIDYESGEVLPDEKELRAFLKGYKDYFPYDYDGIGEQSFTNHGHRKLLLGQSLFWYPVTVADAATGVSVMKGESCDYVVRSIPGQTGEIVGETSSGLMAISANSKNSLNAYRFIKFMLSFDTQKDYLTKLAGIPILKEAIRKIVCEAPAEKDIGIGTIPDYENSAFTEEEAEAFIEIITDVDRFVIEMPVTTDMLHESMLPFFKAEASYKSCLAELRSKLTFYLSE